MKERRKYERVEFHISLTVDQLYDQQEIKEIPASEIEVVNISEGGLGFVSAHKLEMNFYFNARIVIDNEKQFYSVLKIVHVEPEGDKIYYGCEFVGLADILSKSVSEYRNEVQHDNK